MARFSFRVQNSREVDRQLDSLTTTMLKNVRNAIELGCISIEADAVEECPVDLGDLRSSIGYDVSSGNNPVGTIFASAEQASHIEFGTDPHFPPIEPLEEWARRHGLEGAGFAIALKISEEGTQPQPFMQPALEKNRRRVEANIIQAIRRSTD